MTIDEARSTIERIAERLPDEVPEADAEQYIADAVRAVNAYAHSIATSLDRIATAAETLVAGG